MADTGDLSRGAFLRYNGDLCVVLEYEHRTPGNLRAFFQAKMRNVKSGKFVEARFRAGESLDFVRVDVKEQQVLYKDGDAFVVMDQETYDQVHLPEILFGDAAGFLKDGMIVRVSYEGSEAIYAEAPNTVELEVTYTEPGLRGDTATRTLKPATLEGGVEIRVPLFVNSGEKIKVDTRTREYIERVK